MKKLISKILWVALCCILVCNVAACGSKSGENQKPEEPPIDDNPPTPQETYYTATAKDQNGTLLEGFWLEIFYYDNFGSKPTYTNVSVTRAQTDATGTATFTNFTPDAGIPYRVRPYGSYPYNYTPPADPASFDSNKTATLVFTYYPHKFPGTQTPQLDYKREYNSAGEPTVTYTPMELNLSANEDNYFSFSPYVALPSVGEKDRNPETGDQYGEAGANEENAKRLTQATMAATGKYEIGFETSDDAQIVLTHYNGTPGNISLDDDGRPNSVITSTDSATQGIALNLHSFIVRSQWIFGIISEQDCAVTITVTRTDDADEPVINRIHVEATEIITEEKWTQGAQNPEETLELVPLDGSRQVVKDSDGYYHVGEVTGPYLYVQLTNTLDRVGECSIIDYPRMEVQGQPVGESAFIFSSWNSDQTEQTIYDYNRFITAYAEKVNNDGVYPVNEEMRGFLTRFCSKTISAGTVNNDYLWLVACQYYTVVSGSAANPVALTDGNNAVNLTQLGLTVAVLRFTAQTDGVYSFAADTDNFEPVSASTYTVNGIIYAVLSAGEYATMRISGRGTVNVTVDTATALSAVANGKGTQNDPYILSQGGILPYRIDSDVCAEGVYVRLQTTTAGQYVFELGKDACAVYNNQTYTSNSLTIRVASAGTQYDILLSSSKAIKDGIYWLNINRVFELSMESSENIELAGYGDATYSFTAPNDGLYKLVLTGTDVIDATYNDTLLVMQGKFSSYFVLEAGQTAQITFINSDRDMAASCSAVIEQITAFDVGEIVLPAIDTPLEFRLNTPTAKTYQIVVERGVLTQSSIPNCTIKINGKVVTFTEDRNQRVATVSIGPDDVISIEADNSISLMFTEA